MQFTTITKNELEKFILENKLTIPVNENDDYEQISNYSEDRKFEAHITGYGVEWYGKDFPDDYHYDGDLTVLWKVTIQTGENSFRAFPEIQAVKGYLRVFTFKNSGAIDEKKFNFDGRGFQFIYTIDNLSNVSDGTLSVSHVEIDIDKKTIHFSR